MDVNGLKLKAQKWREHINESKGEIKRIKKNIDAAIREVEKSREDLERTQKAQIISQVVAQETQEKLEYKLNNLVSIALKAVFGERAYEMKMKFSMSHGKTIAEPMFKRGKALRKPGLNTGFGPMNIASFALRPTLWSLEKNHKRKRPVFIFDEPDRNLSDPTGELTKRFSQVIHEISERLGIQIIIITQKDAIGAAADRVMQVDMKNGESFIKEKNDG